MSDAPDGHDAPLGSLIARHYSELRALAGWKSRTAGGVYSPTSIVQETTSRLMQQVRVPDGKEHFLAIAATVMTRVILDGVRATRAEKRGGGWSRVDHSDRMNDGASAGSRELPERATSALAELAAKLPRKAEAFTLHVLCEMTVPAVAKSLGVSVPTAERDIRFARAWIGERVLRETEP